MLHFRTFCFPWGGKTKNPPFLGNRLFVYFQVPCRFHRLSEEMSFLFEPNKNSSARICMSSKNRFFRTRVKYYLIQIKHGAVCKGSVVMKWSAHYYWNFLILYLNQIKLGWSRKRRSDPFMNRIKKFTHGALRASVPIFYLSQINLCCHGTRISLTSLRIMMTWRFTGLIGHPFIWFK